MTSVGRVTTGFDNFENEPVIETRGTLKPFWVDNKKLKNKKKYLERFNEILPALEDRERKRIELNRSHLAWWIGNIEPVNEFLFSVPGRREAAIPRRIVPVIMNHIASLLEDRVAALSRFKPAFTVLPNNDEYGDKIKARLYKTILDNVGRMNKLDLLLNELERWNGIFGEVYAFIEWNENIGPKTTGGKRAGDVQITLKEPWYIFPEPRRRWERVNYVIEILDVMHVEEVRERWNAPKIEPDKSTAVFGFDGAGFDKGPEEMVVYRVWHKPGEFTEEPKVVTLTKGEILEFDGKYPEHGDWPFEQLTDLAAPTSLHGFSMFNHIVPVQHQYNKLSAIVHRNLMMFAHPKWMMPAGAAKLASLGNAATIVEYKGQRAPELVSFNATPPEVFNYRTQLREEMGQIYGSFGISRGEPPPGIRAGIALQFLEEQENQQRNSLIIKHNDFIRRMYLKAGKVVRENYKTDDKRILAVLGKENEFDIRALEDKDLSLEFDIQIQNSTALSESKAGRIAQIIELRNNFGAGVVTDQMAIDLLDLAQSDKYINLQTAAIRVAQSENQDFIDGRPVSAPAKEERHLEHWRIHHGLFQSRAWKEDVPSEFKESALDHMRAHEALMILHGKKNQVFGEQLMALENFPSVLNIPGPLALQLQPQLPVGPANGDPAGLAGLLEGGLAGEAVPTGEGVPLGEGGEPPEELVPPGTDIEEQDVLPQEVR